MIIIHINLKVLKAKVIFRKKIILKILLIIKKIIINLNNLNIVNLII
jgi:hypothetical protein